MTDPGLKLPLETRKAIYGVNIYQFEGSCIATAFAEYLTDDDHALAQHRANIIVAALTADAEGESLSPAVCRAMARFYTGLADSTEKKPAPRCNEVVNGHLCQLAEDHEEDCGPLFTAEKEEAS